jgi:dihydroorotase-like cyclic amidohydrolase
MVSSDHAPHTREEKEVGWTKMWSAHTGTPGIQYYYPLLLDAVVRGELTLQRVSELVALSPADKFGLAAKKGAIAVGLDADLVVADLDKQWTITNDGVLSRCGWTPYDGRTINAAIERTYVRGVPVFENDKVVGQPGHAKLAVA